MIKGVRTPSLPFVLMDTGAGQMLAETFTSNVSLAFFIDALVRIIQESATVAMITSAILNNAVFRDSQLALMVVAIACGVTIVSHVNDI